MQSTNTTTPTQLFTQALVDLETELDPATNDRENCNTAHVLTALLRDGCAAVAWFNEEVPGNPLAALRWAQSHAVAVAAAEIAVRIVSKWHEDELEPISETAGRFKRTLQRALIDGTSFNNTSHFAEATEQARQMARGLVLDRLSFLEAWD